MTPTTRSTTLTTRNPRLGSALAALLLVTSACSISVYDELADETWVYATTGPEEFSSSGLGVAMSSGGGEGMPFVSAAKASPALLLTRFAADGTPTERVANVREYISAAEAFDENTVMATDIEEPSASMGNVAVGVFDAQNGYLFMINGNTGEVTAPFGLAGGAEPSGIAFGDTDASAATDVFALAGTTLSLIPDYKAASDPNGALACELASGGAGLAIAEVDDSSTGAEVLLALGGEILVFPGSVVANADQAGEDCFATASPLATLSPVMAAASFGSEIFAGDIDGNGAIDIVASAPDEGRVVVFRDWSVADRSVGEELPTPSASVQFGASLALGDLNGDGADEIIVGDPGVSVEDNAMAGAVYVYRDGQTPVALHDAQPEVDQRFGQSVATSLGGSHQRLAVGAKEEVFHYFRTPVEGDTDFRQ